MSSMWVEKYKPKSVDEMCYPAKTRELREWLRNWNAAFNGSSKAAPKRAALLSGTPGVGKTSSVYLCAKELGYDVVEFNTSDNRSAKSLRETVTQVRNNFCLSTTVGATLSSRKTLLLMDEVDGCDRGGVGEVITMIKSTKMPVICTCNDRFHQKLKSLVDHCEDYRFQRPPFNVVAGYIQKRILVPERISVDNVLLEKIIQGNNNDIRSVVNQLQFGPVCAKDQQFGLFQTAEQFLSSSTAERNYSELQSLYYSEDLVDLFVHENYVHFKPADARKSWMTSVERAAASIAHADTLSKHIYIYQTWSLSPLHVFHSAIMPGMLVRGKYVSFAAGGWDHGVRFPAWLGNNSTYGKNKRIVTCIAKQSGNPLHGASGGADDMALDYIPHFAHALVLPLVNKEKATAIAESIRIMDSYGLMKDDFDAILDVSAFKKFKGGAGKAKPWSQVPAPLKSALTREFNKTHKTESLVKSRLGKRGREGDNDGQGDDDGDDDENGGGPVAPKPPAKAAPSKTRAGAKGTTGTSKRGAAAKKKTAGDKMTFVKD